MGSHIVEYFWKKRNSNTKRLEREYELAVKKQEKLAQKMGKAGPETGSAHASAVEDKPPFSAVWFDDMKTTEYFLFNLIE